MTDYTYYTTSGDYYLREVAGSDLREVGMADEFWSEFEGSKQEFDAMIWCAIDEPRLPENLRPELTADDPEAALSDVARETLAILRSGEGRYYYHPQSTAGGEMLRLRDLGLVDLGTDEHGFNFATLTEEAQ